jgi:hypothetical protein
MAVAGYRAVEGPVFRRWQTHMRSIPWQANSHESVISELLLPDQCLGY